MSTADTVWDDYPTMAADHARSGLELDPLDVTILVAMMTSRLRPHTLQARDIGDAVRAYTAADTDARVAAALALHPAVNRGKGTMASTRYCPEDGMPIPCATRTVLTGGTPR